MYMSVAKIELGRICSGLHKILFLVMALMRKVARNHGFRVLLHEKPFKGVNGSGKPNNWSLGTDTGILLHAPGKLPAENLRFITFVVNTLMAVYLSLIHI